MKPEQLEALREGNRLEAKLAKGGVPASVWETYSAFANTEGGTILLGVAEHPDGGLDYVGVPNPDVLIKKFWDGVNNPAKVSANVLSSGDVLLINIDGASVVRIEVPRANRQLRPVYVGKDRERGTFRRNGEGDYHCTSEEVLAMVRDASPVPLDATVLEEAPLKALSEETVRRFRSSVEAARPGHPWLSLPIEDFLVKLNAADRERGEGPLHPTKAGLLMFGYEHEIVKEYPDYFLDYREVGGAERWRDRVMSQDGTWSGNLFDFWLEAFPRLRAAVKHGFALDSALRRVDETSMHVAVREAFVNALVHADYYGRRGIVVIRHPDRIEVTNPGGSRVALDVMVAGGVSDARNPTLMKMFGLLNVCEKAGSGFDVMRKAAQEADAHPPAVTQLLAPDQVQLTLFLGTEAAASPAEGAVLSGPAVPPREEEKASRGARARFDDSLSRDQELIVEMAQAQGSFTRGDVERLLGCGPTKAKGLVSSLLEAGVLASEGAARSTRYRLAG